MSKLQDIFYANNWAKHKTRKKNYFSDMTIYQSHWFIKFQVSAKPL